jgi:hypothetical protein
MATITLQCHWQYLYMNSGVLAAQRALTAVKFWRQRVNNISVAATSKFQTVLNCLLVFACFYGNTHGTNSVSLIASYT